MAIVNGNYQFFDINTISDNLTNVFSEYYGKDSRSFVVNKVNNVEFIFYHNFKKVHSYYNDFITKYEREILDEFYKAIGKEKNGFSIDLLKFNNGTDNNLKRLVYYDYSIANKFNNKVNKELLYSFMDSFDLYNLSDEELFDKAKEYYSILQDCIKKVEERHPCQVFEDVRQVECNIVDLSVQFIKYANNLLGYNLEDNARLDDNLKYYDLYQLNSYGRLFYEDLTQAGLIKAFTSENQAIIDSNKSNSLSIIVDRLKYLVLSGAEFKYIDKEDLLTDKIIFEPNARDLIMKEYNYQQEQSLDIIVPCDVADNIENQRLNMCNVRYRGAQCYPQSELFNDSISDIEDNPYCCLETRRTKNIDKCKNYIIINLDDCLSNKKLLSVIIHEMNHNMGAGKYVKIANNVFLRQNGIASHKYYVDDNGQILMIFDKNKNYLIEEYANEMQTKDMVDLYLSKYPMPEIISNGDNSDKKNGYLMFKPVLDEFYNTFRDELKDTKVHRVDLLYSNANMPESNIDDLVQSFIEIGVDFFENGNNSSFLQMFDLDLNEYVNIYTKFDKFVSKYLRNYNRDIFNMKEMMTNFSAKEYSEYKSILKEIRTFMKKILNQKSKFRYNLESVKSIVKPYKNGVINYRVLESLNGVLEEYLVLMDKYLKQGKNVFAEDNDDELLKKELSYKDYLKYKKLMLKKKAFTKAMQFEKKRRENLNTENFERI